MTGKMSVDLSLMSRYELFNLILRNIPVKCDKTK